MRLARIAALFLLIASQAADAGELRLRNGAVIPGELTRVEAHKIVWAADLIGSITVETRAIVSLSSAVKEPLRVGEDELQDCTVRGGRRDVVLQCGEARELATTWNDVEAAEPQSSGKITASLTRERGNDFTDEYEGDARATLRRGQRRHELEASVDYEKKSNRATEDEADLSYQLDFLRRGGWYRYTKLDYTRNRFEALQEATTAGAGIGRTLHLARGLNLRLQGGPDVARFDLEDYGRGTEGGGNLQWRVDWKTALWTLDLTVFHEGEYRWLFDDTDVSRLDTRTGVALPLVQGLIAEIRLDYDRVGLQVPGFDNTDQEWVFALGYKW